MARIKPKKSIKWTDTFLSMAIGEEFEAPKANENTIRRIVCRLKKEKGYVFAVTTKETPNVRITRLS